MWWGIWMADSVRWKFCWTEFVLQRIHPESIMAPLKRPLLARANSEFFSLNTFRWTHCPANEARLFSPNQSRTDCLASSLLPPNSCGADCSGVVNLWLLNKWVLKGENSEEACPNFLTLHLFAEPVLTLGIPKNANVRLGLADATPLMLVEHSFQSKFIFLNWLSFSGCLCRLCKRCNLNRQSWTLKVLVADKVLSIADGYTRIFSCTPA